MPSEYKDIEWLPEHFRQYAVQQSEEVEREIFAVEQQIRQFAGSVFVDGGAADRLIRETDRVAASGGSLGDLKDVLNNKPQRLGRLHGSLFRPEQQEEVRQAAKFLAVHLQARCDLKIVAFRFDDLFRRAVEAEQSPREAGEKGLPMLREQRMYCDATRETRSRDYRDGLATVQDINRDPSAARGDRQSAGEPGDQWWRSGVAETGPKTERVEEPAQSRSDWWRKEERPDETERDLEQERERDRHRR